MKCSAARVAFGVFLALVPRLAFADGSISGRVTEALTGNPREQITVIAWDGAAITRSSVSDFDGTYTIANVPSGSYYLYTSNARGYVNQLHNNITCVGCDPLTGTPVVVSDGDTTEGVDFSLSSGARITGRVLANGSCCLSGVEVEIYTASGRLAARGVTDFSGAYRSDAGLTAGTYYARTRSSKETLLDVAYGGYVCYGDRTCEIVTTGAIAVTAGQTTSGIDLNMASTGARFRGRVSDHPSSSRSINDDFNDGVMAGKWFAVSHPAAEALETGGRMELRTNPDSYFDFKRTTVTSTCQAVGNFTADIDFSLANWGFGNEHTFSFVATDLAAFGVDAPGISLVASPDGVGDDIYRFEGTSVSSLGSGRFRLRRTGDLLEAFYWNGTTFTLLGSTTVPPSLLSTSFALKLSGIVYGPTAIAIDNFTVTTGSTTCGIDGVAVDVYSSSSALIGRVQTDPAGRYTTFTLPHSDGFFGGYLARTNNRQGWLDQAYSGHTCVDCLPDDAIHTKIMLPAAYEIVENTDFRLERGDSFGGIVRNAETGAPVPGINVAFYESETLALVHTTTTDASGVYLSAALPDRTPSVGFARYYIRTINSTAFEDRVYPGSRCSANCDIRTGWDTSGFESSPRRIDFNLRPSGKVTGFVRRASDGTGIFDIPVYLVGPDGAFYFYSNFFTGSYTADQLPVGTYYARTYDQRYGYRNRLYDGIACDICPVTNGTPITVTHGGIVSNVNFSLAAGGYITGFITDSANGTGLQNVGVSIYDANNVAVSGGRSYQPNGFYSTIAIPPGTYYAVARPNGPYGHEVYSNVDCVGCTPSQVGTPIVVDTSQVTNINFTLTAGGRITGRVTAASGGAGLGGVEVNIYHQGSTSPIGTVFTDASGNYQSAPLGPATYYVATDNEIGYIDQAYNNVACLDNCNVRASTGVTVAAGVNTPDINFALSTGGRVSGNVLHLATAAPLSNITVDIYNGAGQRVALATTNASGAYSVTTGLPPGVYYAKTSNGSNYINKLFNGVECLNCSVTAGTGIEVVPGLIKSGVNFTLRPGGSIAGQVTAIGGGGIGGVKVHIYDESGNQIQERITADNGTYATSVGLPDGAYFLRTSNTAAYIDRLYDVGLCVGSCMVTQGTAVIVLNSSAKTGINFALELGAGLSGRVYDAASFEGLADVSVRIYTEAGQLIGSQTTVADGSFAATIGLPEGRYFVKSSNNRGYIEKVYDNLTCLDCVVTTSSTPIDLAAGQVRHRIDFALVLGGRVAGRVTDQAGGRPLPDVTISIFDAAGESKATTTTDVTGNYMTSGLPAGNYTARTTNIQGYIEELWNDRRCVGCAVTTGSVIPVTVGAIRNDVHFELELGGRVAGTVSDGLLGRGLSGVNVQIFNEDGDFISRVTDASGTYTTPALPQGLYFARTSNTRGFTDLLHGRYCGFDPVTDGLPFMVTPGQVYPVNFAMFKPTASLYRFGELMGVTADQGPCSPNDRVGLFQLGAPDSDPYDWRYLNGEQTPPVIGMKTANVGFPVPSAAGLYEARFLYNGPTPGTAVGPRLIVTSLPSVVSNKSEVAPGDTVNALITNAPGNDGDWVGLFDSTGRRIEWRYLNGLSSRPVTGNVNAVVTFEIPRASSNNSYHFELFLDDTDVKLAESQSFGAPAAVPAITLSAIHVSGGMAVTATFVNTPGGRGDWIGIFPVTGNNSTTVDWRYLNGLPMVPTSGRRSGSVTFAMPRSPGVYNIRVFGDPGGFITASPPITVTAALPSLTLCNVGQPGCEPSVPVGATVTARVINGPGLRADWIGVYTLNGSQLVNWRYLNGLQALPAEGHLAADVPIPMSIAPGQYVVKFMKNGQEDVLAIGEILTVTAAPAATITVCPAGQPGCAPSVTAGATVTARVANGPGLRYDWIAVFPVGGSSFGNWRYLNGSMVPPATGAASADLTIPMPSIAGQFVVKLLRNNQLEELAVSETITVTALVSSITVPASVQAGAPFTAAIVNGPGQIGDWVGIYAVGDTQHAQFRSWSYLNGQASHPANGLANVSVPMIAPAAPGTYYVRLYQNDSSTLRATSAVITVTAPPTVTAAVSGNNINVSVQDPPGHTADWVGVFPVGAADNAYVSWRYLNGLMSPPGSPVASPAFSIPVPAAPGNYVVRLFYAGGLSRRATSGSFTVSAATVSLNTTTVSPGGSVVATIANGPANAGDWVGVYSTGAPAAQYRSWKYLSNSTLRPASGVAGAAVLLTMPSTPGAYEIRFFSNDSFTVLSTSAPITVTP